MSPAFGSPDLAAWLDVLCRMIPGVKAAVATGTIDAAGVPHGFVAWPPNNPLDAQLLELARSVCTKRLPLVVPRGSGAAGAPVQDAPTAIGFPLLRDRDLHGAIAVAVDVPDAQRQSVVQMLRWGSTWLDLLRREAEGGVVSLTRSTDVQPDQALGAVAAALAESGPTHAALAAVNALAASLGCQRVSWGTVSEARSRVLAISDTAQVDARREAVRAIGAAMDEAVDQTAPVVLLPGRPGVEALAAHRGLSDSNAGACVISVPVLDDDRTVGVITAEFTEPSAAGTIASVCGEAGPALAAALALQSRRGGWGGARRSRRWGRGLAVAGVLLALVGGGYALSQPTTLTISAPARIEGSVQRALVAPFDGYLAEVNASAGDTVEAGQVLLRLEDQQLKLERRQLAGDRKGLATQHRRALAGFDKSEAHITNARIAQVDARLALVDLQIEQSTVKAPFTGQVIRGDLRRALGKPVRRGEVLLELAPVNEYRVALEVRSYDVAEVRAGQTGDLRLVPLPDEVYPVTVQKVASVAGDGADDGLFRVEARLASQSPRLRPGMQGVVKLPVGERPRVQAWLRRAIVPIRLWWWTYAP